MRFKRFGGLLAYNKRLKRLKFFTVWDLHKTNDEFVVTTSSRIYSVISRRWTMVFMVS